MRDPNTCKHEERDDYGGGLTFCVHCGCILRGEAVMYRPWRPFWCAPKLESWHLFDLLEHLCQRARDSECARLKDLLR